MTSINFIRISIVALGLLMFAVATQTVALAQEHESNSEPLLDVYSIHAEAQGDVNNDLLSVELVVEGEDRDSATLANRINATMQWAIEKTRKQPSIKSSTRNYNTWPRYDRKNNKIIGWHASQSLALESEDFDATRKMIQTLQEKLQIRGMQMTAKPETRTAREDDLINDALNRFKSRALIVQQNQGAAGYRVLDVNINTNQNHVPYMRSASQADMSSVRVESAPVIEGGTRQIIVRINGRVQLQ